MLKLVLFEYVPGTYGFRFELNGTAVAINTRQYFSTEALLHDLREFCTGINLDQFTVYDDTDNRAFTPTVEHQTV